MSANERAPATMWYWKDYLTDPGVRGMTFDERGRYVEVLAITHQTDEPGVMTEEQVRIWATYTIEEWAEHRAAFTAVFKIQGNIWVQKRTVEDRRKQKRRFEQSQRGGRTSAARARDSLGRLEPHSDAGLDGDMESGLGTPSSPFASSSSMRRDPTPPFPADPSASPPPLKKQRRSHGAERGNGPIAIGDLLGSALAGPGAASREPEVSGFSDSFLGRMRRMFPGVDVYAVAVAVRDAARAGGVHNLEGLVVHRCQQLAPARAGASPVVEANSNGPLVPAQTEAAHNLAKRVSGADAHGADPPPFPPDEAREDAAC